VVGPERHALAPAVGDTLRSASDPITPSGAVFMIRPTLVRALRRALRQALLALAAGACAGGPSDAEAATAVAVESPASAGSAAPLAFTAADLDAYVRGIAREAELVRAARERGRAATTPAERGAAAQAQWEAATIPGGAQAAGLPTARYRPLRETVHQVLSTLDLQGKIDGPQELSTSALSPQMKQRLASDPFAELAPASAAALRARMDRVVPAYVAYMTLVAVNG
jgi:hypothetical protein